MIEESLLLLLLLLLGLLRNNIGIARRFFGAIHILEMHRKGAFFLAHVKTFCSARISVHAHVCYILS